VTPSETNEGLLEQVLKETAEQAAFLFLDGEGSAANSDVELVHATITLSPAGASEQLVLRMTEVMAREIAANMLGSDKDDPEVVSSANSAVGELLNIIAGAFAVARFGKGTHCDIGIPVVAAGRGPEGKGVTLWSDGSPIELLRAS